MNFEWDEAKNKINRDKHGLSFEVSSEAFSDPYMLSWLDNRYLYEEERWISLGAINGVLIVVAAHTYRSDENGEEVIRIISARKANKKEKEKYFQYREQNETKY